MQYWIMPACLCPERKVRAKKRKEQEPLVLDVSTMSLRSIIKVAYAKERARFEEEKRKKVTPPQNMVFSILALLAPLGEHNTSQDWL